MNEEDEAPGGGKTHPQGSKTVQHPPSLSTHPPTHPTYLRPLSNELAGPAFHHERLEGVTHGVGFSHFFLVGLEALPVPDHGLVDGLVVLAGFLVVHRFGLAGWVGGWLIVSLTMLPCGCWLGACLALSTRRPWAAQ